MKKRPNPTVDDAGDDPANPQAIADKSGQRKDGSAEGPAANATQHRDTPADELWQKIAKLLPKPSRNKLKLHEERILFLRYELNYTLKDVRSWLLENVGWGPSESTLSVFYKTHKKRSRKASRRSESVEHKQGDEFRANQPAKSQTAANAKKRPPETPSNFPLPKNSSPFTYDETQPL